MLLGIDSSENEKRMTRTNFYLKGLLILPFFLLLLSCVSYNPASDDDGLLYSVNSHGAYTSYILGSMHGDGHRYTIEEINSVFPNLQTVFTDIQTVVTETNKNLRDSFVINDCVEAAKLLMNVDRPNTLNMMPNGITYKNLLQGVQYKVVDEYLMRRFPSTSYSMYKPAYWLLRLPFSLYADSLNAKSVDQCIYEYAILRGKETMCLESYVDQISSNISILKDSLEFSKPLNEQAKILYRKILQIDSIKKNYKDLHYCLHNYYMNRDKEGLDKINLYLNDSIIYRHSISERNKKWIPKIIKFVQEKPCLIVVGERHLAGRDGLVSLLRKKGYLLEKLN